MEQDAYGTAAAPTKTCVSITSEIFLHTTRHHHPPPVRVRYEIENNSPMELDFILNFNESQNLLLSDHNANPITNPLQLQLHCQISPYSQQFIGEIQSNDLHYRTVLKTKYHWKKRSLGESKIRELALVDKGMREVCLSVSLSYLYPEILMASRLRSRK